MIDIDTLVGRLMDLETKFYDLQERYHHLINEYEKLKESYEGRRGLCSVCEPQMVDGYDSKK